MTARDFFNRIFLNNKCKPQTGEKLRNRQLIQENAWFGGDFLYIYILLRIANELGQIEVETDPDSILENMQISSIVVSRRLPSTDSRLVWRKSQFFSSLWFAFILRILAREYISIIENIRDDNFCPKDFFIK